MPKNKYQSGKSSDKSKDDKKTPVSGTFKSMGSENKSDKPTNKPVPVTGPVKSMGSENKSKDKTETNKQPETKKPVTGFFQSMHKKTEKFGGKGGKTEQVKDKYKEEHQKVTGLKDRFIEALKGVKDGVTDIAEAGIKGLETHGATVVKGVDKFSKVGVEGVKDVLKGEIPLKAFKDLANFKENEFQTLWRHAMDNLNKGKPVEMLNDLSKDIVPVFHKLSELLGTFDKEVLGSRGKDALTKMDGGLDKIAKGISSFMETSEGKWISKAIENAMENLLKVVQSIMKNITQALGVGKTSMPTNKPF